MILKLLWLTIALPRFVWGDPERPLTFAIVAKLTENPFFRIVEEGCVQASKRIGAECLFVGPTDAEDPELQAKIILELVQNGTADGIAVSASSSESFLSEAINEASLQVPVVTFDSDFPETNRAAYVGTDNFFFGQTIGRLLIQLQPQGGIYAILGALAPNIQDRFRGIRDALKEIPQWQELNLSPGIFESNLTVATLLMEEFTSAGATAILPTLGAPMRAPGYMEFASNHPEITIVSGDAFSNQLEFLNRNLAGGLVGQLPFEMGTRSIGALWNLHNGIEVEPSIGTNVLTHVRVPLILPELQVDHNMIGDLRYTGFCLFGISAILCIVFSGWIFLNRKQRVVKVAQPLFLFMVAIGVFIFSSALIPLSLDEGSDQVMDISPYQNDVDSTRHIGVCMSVPWLTSVGFTITFSALFSKTMRVNRIFLSKRSFARLKVEEKDVLVPFLLLLSLNVLILTVWTILDPLSYTREPHSATDGWQRLTSTYGSCQSDDTSYYLGSLAVVNLAVLVLANWQAYRARFLETEFSESKCIAICMACILQVSVMGLPSLLIVRDNPQAFYLLLVFAIFVVSMTILIAIFVPKMVAAQSSPEEQISLVRKALQKSIVTTSQPGFSVSGDGGAEGGMLVFSRDKLHDQYNGDRQVSVTRSGVEDSVRRAQVESEQQWCKEGKGPHVVHQEVEEPPATNISGKSTESSG